jgi:hypothetical protein
VCSGVAVPEGSFDELAAFDDMFKSCSSSGGQPQNCANPFAAAEVAGA